MVYLNFEITGLKDDLGISAQNETPLSAVHLNFEHVKYLSTSTTLSKYRILQKFPILDDVRKCLFLQCIIFSCDSKLISIV